MGHPSGWVREDGACFARMPTLGAMKLRRRWGTRVLGEDDVCVMDHSLQGL
jgi:hypothetical protein